MNDPVLDYSNGVISVQHTIHNEAKLTPGNRSIGKYGCAVAMDNDYAIVGDRFGGSPDIRDCGAAYVYRREGGVWVHEAKLTAGDATEDDRFGDSVSIDGDYAVVGAQRMGGSGAAYIFRREGGVWVQEAKLVAGDGQEGDCFGTSVSIYGEYAVVGAEGAGDYSGAAYVFRRQGTVWVEQDKFVAGDPAAYNHFGCSVDISGEHILIGAYGTNNNTGNAYIYRREGPSWVMEAYLAAGDADAQDNFGTSVSLDRGYAVVGAWGEGDSGAAYVFKRQESIWMQQSKLVAGDAEKGDSFGKSVSIDGDYVVVGADGDSGAAYVFKQQGSTWVEQARLVAGDSEKSDYFGSSVAISGGYAVVGAPGYYDPRNYGAAYIYSVFIVDISVDQETININESATLSWFFTDATSVIIDNGIGEVSQNGSIIISPAETTTYTITATGQWGTFTDSVTVMVLFPPEIDINADPQAIFPGDSSTLSWTSMYAESCIIEPDIGSVPLNGSVAVSPSKTTVYTLTATGSDGTTVESVEVVVVEDMDYGLDTDEQEGGGGLVGETVRILNGNLIEYRNDPEFPSPNSLGLGLQAFYNSRSDKIGAMGYGWTHTYEESLLPSVAMGTGTYLKILDQMGRAHYFADNGGGLYTGAFHERSHVKLESGTYVWHRLDGSRHGFASSGEPCWMDDAAGNRLELSYDGNGRLETVTDIASGRMLTFHYNAGNLLAHVSGPVTDQLTSGIWVTYEYDATQNLVSAAYADCSCFYYFYEDPQDPHNLTKKTNWPGHLINTWSYDNQDRVVSNFSRDGKGVEIEYVSETQVNVTDAYGKLREYFLDKIGDRKRVSAVINGPGGAGGFPYSQENAVSWIYDEHMRLSEVEYAGGAINQYMDYDERGNPGTVKLAAGTTEERIISFTYHPYINIPLTRVEVSVLGVGNKETVWDYDNDYDAVPNENPSALPSRVLEKGFVMDEQGAIVSQEYITTYNYNSKGQVLSIDGPLPGNDDTTGFTYDAATGDLLSITKPLIGPTAFSGYDAAGHAGQITDVNGRIKTLDYDSRGPAHTYA